MTSVAIFAIVFQAYSKNRIVYEHTIKTKIQRLCRLNFFHLYSYLSSILTNIIICSMLRYNTKPNNKLFVYGSWHHVKFSGCIYCTQKLLVEFVTSSQSKTYQRQLNNRDVLIQRDPIDREK